MDEHIDTMGFMLAAIVISVTLLSTRETTRSDRQIDRTNTNEEKLHQMLLFGKAVPLRQLREWIEVASARRDFVVTAARILNGILVVITLGIAVDAYILLRMDPSLGPVHAKVLLLALAVGAFCTGLYGEIHALLDRRKAKHRFRTGDLGILSDISDSLMPAGSPKSGRRQSKISKKKLPWKFEPGSLSADAAATLDRKLNNASERFPSWDLLTELTVMSKLMRSDPESALATLREDGSEKSNSYNFAILLTVGLARADRLDEALPRLEELARDNAGDRNLEELCFDLSLVNAHRESLFSTTPKPFVEEFSEYVPLAFDARLDSVRETSALMTFGRSWIDPNLEPNWLPSRDGDNAERPIDWLWQMVMLDGVPNTLADMLTWRDRPVNRLETSDAAALESLGFGCLVSDRNDDNDDATKLFEAAIRADSTSGSAHWGAAIAYFKRAWYDKAETSLNHARICGYSPEISALTGELFHFYKHGETDEISEVLRRGRKLSERNGSSLVDRVDLSLIGVSCEIPDDGSPRARLAARFGAKAEVNLVLHH